MLEKEITISHYFKTQAKKKKDNKQVMINYLKNPVKY